MTEFTTKDRILITRHDVKLGTLCREFKELKESLKEDKKDLKDDLGKIFDKLDSNNTNCSSNRSSCQKEIAEKITDVTKTVDEKAGKFFTKSVLMWIFFFIISGIISIGVFSGKTFSKAKVNEQRIIDMHPKGNQFNNHRGGEMK